MILGFDWSPLEVSWLKAVSQIWLTPKPVYEVLLNSDKEFDVGVFSGCQPDVTLNSSLWITAKIYEKQQSFLLMSLTLAKNVTS